MTTLAKREPGTFADLFDWMEAEILETRAPIAAAKAPTAKHVSVDKG